MVSGDERSELGGGSVGCENYNVPDYLSSTLLWPIVWIQIDPGSDIHREFG
jgi:hypothetical protein